MQWSALLLLAGAQTAFASASCKCTPNDDCWPSLETWNALNSSVDGKLIENRPRAEVCYPGDEYDAEACQYVGEQWGNSSVIQTIPIGYSYPYVVSCPPINTTVASYPNCELGSAPAYTINATGPEDVAAGIRFAKENNIRLVIKNTGHDMQARSQGYASLSIWVRYIRTGLELQDTYSSSVGCTSNWTGKAITIGGGYVWGEVYDYAADHGVIAVGGADKTVGSTGAFFQSGGHSPTGHYFGLGTDQVLEYEVVLASGEVVTANSCQYQDLFTALRGGGGGTYGVVISATVKAHPTHPFLGHTLAVIPLNQTSTEGVSLTVNVTAQIQAAFSILFDAGFSGYAFAGDGSLESSELPANLYAHSFGVMLPNDTSARNTSIANAKSLVNKLIVEPLAAYNNTEYIITSSWSTYDSFADYYPSVGGESWVGNTNIILSSWMFDKTSLLNKTDALRDMLHTIFLEDDQETLTTTGTMFLMNLVGGGKVFESQPYTSVNPAWRKTYVLNEIISTWDSSLSLQQIKKFKEDVVFRKTDAMRNAAPGMGSYINEHTRQDPTWKSDYWGPASNYNWLKSIKTKYDPTEVFWCHHCVGSEGWVEVTGGKEAGYGPLCQTNSTLQVNADKESI